MATYTGKVDRSEPKRKKKKASAVPTVTDNTPSSDGGRFPIRGETTLGSGMAEKARRRLRDRKGQIDKASGN